MRVYGELQYACLEVLSSDPTGPTAGRIWFNTTENRVKFDDGNTIRALLRNDFYLVIGNDGTAANNVRFNRAGGGLLQILPGGDVTAEGALSTTLAELSSRLENYTDAGKPAFGNAGRVIYVTDLQELQFDDGTQWVTVGTGVDGGANLGGFTEVFKDRTGTTLNFRTVQSSDSSVSITQNTNDIDLLGAKLQSQTFNADNTFVVPDTVTSVMIRAAGGGGGGGGGSGQSGASQGGGGGGGGAGAQPFVEFFPTTPGETLTITVGTAGTAGTAGSVSGNGGAGGSGGSSIVSGLAGTRTFPGGAGGSGGTASGGVGGSGGTGTFTPISVPVAGGGGGNSGAVGTAGASGTSGSNSRYGTGGTGGLPGSGGIEGHGGGGGGGGAGLGNGGAGGHGGAVDNGGITAGTAAAANSSAGGGGGGGAANDIVNAPGAAGGAGGSGQVIIYWVGA